MFAAQLAHFFVQELGQKGVLVYLLLLLLIVIIITKSTCIFYNVYLTKASSTQSMLVNVSVPALQVLRPHVVPAVGVQNSAHGLVETATCQLVCAVWALEEVLPHFVWSPEEEGPLEASIWVGGPLGVLQPGAGGVVQQLVLWGQDRPP